MSHSRPVTLILGLVAAAAIAATLAACGSTSKAAQVPPTTTTTMTNSAPSGTSKAANLRVTLDNLLGEHALLAMNATDAGFSGSKSFPAIAAELDKNSVALSQAIGSVYGAKAGNTFLNGKDMWRAHIGFFVDYTVALAKGDKAGQTKAVNNLKMYVSKFGTFLATATGLPVPAVQADLLAHITQLKQQLDAYASGQYTKAASIFDEAYNHMFMTGDILASAIAKQQGLS
jgi:hypothetical protein